MHTSDPTTVLVPATTDRATIYTREDFGMGWTGVHVTNFSVDAAARDLDAILGVKRTPKFRMPKRGRHAVTRKAK